MYHVTPSRAAIDLVSSSVSKSVSESDFRSVRRSVSRSVSSSVSRSVPVFALSILAVGCSIFEHGGGERATILPSYLVCEYRHGPLGIDARVPRLGWTLEVLDPKARGLRQTAYCILVAGSPEALDADRGDVWDSGEVLSDRSYQVEYAGRPLASGEACWWKVRVRDEAGRLSPWSLPARWTMGLLEAADWEAKWIGCGEEFRKIEKLPPEGEYLRDPWFRKTFTLESAPVRATAYVASVGYHELWVNGEKADDSVLSPSVSDHKHRARYVAYEIGDLLRPGKNVVGLWLGTSWSIFPPFKTADKPQTPIVLAQVDVALPDGKTLRLGTDATWKTHPSENALLGVWMFMDYGGEYQDGTLEDPAWCDPSLDDAAWKSATEYRPNLVLSAEAVEPNRRVVPMQPAAIVAAGTGAGTGTGTGKYRIDMGENFAGMVEFDLRGKPGDLVELQFSEHPEKPITHRLRSAYRIGPSGKGTFRSRFNYMVGRWIEVSGLGYEPSFDDVRAWLVRTDFAAATNFHTSSELLDRIWDRTRWTFENLSLGGYVVDCPQRERMGYGGDGHATTETGLVAYDLGAFYTKWSQDWRDVQWMSPAVAAAGSVEAEGNLPYTAPTYWGGGGPAWSGFCVTLPWEVHEQYGDLRILEVNLPTIERWLSFLETKSKDGLLVRWGGEWDFLGDWLWPGAKGVNGDTRETLYFNNCYWLYNLRTAARIAKVLGCADLAERWTARADTVRRAIHDTFYVPAQASYVDGSQVYLAAALLLEIPPDEFRPAVLKRFEDEILIARKGHFWGGITGGWVLIECLLALDRPDLMLEMATKTDYPSWGDMLGRGATTFWESWEGEDLSLLHSSYLHIGAWMIEGLAGIRPDPSAPGFRRFEIRIPDVDPAKLDRAGATYESPQGRIRSRWEVKDGRLRASVTVPPGAVATLVLPTSDPAGVTEGGIPAADSLGVKPIEARSGRAAFTLEGGSYVFEAAR